MSKLRNLSKRTKILLITLAVTVALVVGAIVLSVLLTPDPDAPKEKDPNLILCEGEGYLSSSGVLMMYPMIGIEQVQTVSVTNADGSYAISRMESLDGEFRLVGMEKLPISAEAAALLAAYASTTTTVDRITDGTNAYRIARTDRRTGEITYRTAVLAQYDLDPEDDDPAHRPSKYTLTKKDGSSVTVYIGAKTPLDNGSYARVEGRSEIYVVQTALASAVNAPYTDLVTPTLIATGLSESDPYIDLRLHKDGSLFLDLQYDASKFGKGDDFYTMKYPLPQNGTSYRVNTDLLYNICSGMTSLLGNRTLAVLPQGIGQSERTELLKQYGIYPNRSDAYIVLEYGFGTISPDILEELGKEDTGGNTVLYPLFFSEKDPVKGTYNVYTLVLGQNYDKEDESIVFYELVVEADAASLAFLDYSSASYVDNALFMENLAAVNKMDFSCTYTNPDGTTAKFDETVTLTHPEVFDSTKTEQEVKDEYSFHYASTNKTYPHGQHTNLARFYTLLLYNLRLHGALTQEEQNASYDAEDVIARITIETRKLVAGAKEEDPPVEKEQTYSFTLVRISSTKVGISLDGGATMEFYALYQPINELLRNLPNLAAGKPITIASSHILLGHPGYVGQP